MKKIISFLIVLILIFSTFSLSFAEVLKDETIYVNLDYNGSPRDIRAVNRIHGESQEEYYIDYGEYKEVKPLVNNIDPIIEKDSIKWPLENLKAGDIYYEARLNKELSMKIDMKYFLDGQEIPGQELAGKSGNFKIEITIEDENNLTTQIQLPLDLDVFSDIKVDGGVISVVGKTMTVAFNSMPIGDVKEEYFSLEAKAENIELEPMTIASTNSKIELPDDLADFSSGIDEMADAFDEIEKGSKDLNKGTKDLKDGSQALSDGIGDFSTGFNKLSRNTGGITQGLNQFNSGFKTLNVEVGGLVSGVGELNKGFKQAVGQGSGIGEGLSGLKEGATQLDGGLKDLNVGLAEVNEGHGQLVGAAQAVADIVEQLGATQDPEVKFLVDGLVNGLIAEGEGIGELSVGLDKSSKGLSGITEAINEIDRGYNEYNVGLNQILGGYTELGKQLQPMPGQLTEMYNGHLELTNGVNSLFGGLDSMDGGISEINKNTKELPSNVGKLADGQESLTEGISKLNKEGMGKIKEAADEFANLNQDDEDEYTSFIDSRNKNNSTFQFIMQTPAVKVEKAKEVVKVEEIEDKNFFQRILDLFRN